MDAISILDMFEYLFSPSTSEHLHIHTAFPTDTIPPVRGLGLDEGSNGSPQPPIDGPVEYILKIATSPAIKNADNVLVQTNASEPTFISLIGGKGATSMIPLKASFKSGSLGEFSTIAKDVGPVKGIKLAEPFGRAATWTPTTVEVNRMGASGAKGAASRPDGWVTFNVNRIVKGPVTIMASGMSGTGANEGSGP